MNLCIHCRRMTLDEMFRNGITKERSDGTKEPQFPISLIHLSRTDFTCEIKIANLGYPLK